MTASEGATSSQLSLREGVLLGAPPRLRLTILTAVRTDEARSATWDEFDLDAALWTIPAARTKTSKELRVPLAEPVVALLRAAIRHPWNTRLGRISSKTTAEPTAATPLGNNHFEHPMMQDPSRQTAGTSSRAST
ncbi:tyrosine-type recombinase/integrase [Mesorhizobium sp. M0622]|uniref:tyrosine-type recombinase/integrase n=1 Tax=unclassified Mesorhizobium TaxID=325217 RepID=UPI00333C1B48